MLVIIRGAGDIATGITLRLHRSGYRLILTDLPQPTSIRRTVCFSEAVWRGRCTVEDTEAVLAHTPQEALALTEQGWVAVLTDPESACIRQLHPNGVVDAILAKRNLGTSMADAPVVIAVGPGFTAGVDCHAAVETMRGHTLGRVLYTGSPLPNTGVPGVIGGRRFSPGNGNWAAGSRRGYCRYGKRRPHGLRHRRMPAGPASRRSDRFFRHEVRRCGSPRQCRQLRDRF